MSEQEPTTIRELKELVRTSVRNEAKYLREAQYREDLLHEIADGCVPVYHSELLDVARSDPSVALDEPEVFAFDGSHSAINAIAANIFYELENVACEEWEAIQAEEDD